MEDCKKKKVVHLCLSCFYVDNYSYQENILPKYHARLGFDVTVIASLVSFDAEGRSCLLPSVGEYMTKDGYKVIRMDYKKGAFRRIYRKLRYYTSTYRLLEQEKPDILFIHGTSFGDAYQVCRYLRKHPYVRAYADSHADWINSGRGWLSLCILHKIIWRHYTKMLLPYLRKVYGVLPIRCDFLNKVYNVPKEKITLLPMGVDDDAIPENRMLVRKTIREKLRLSDDDFLIVTGGKIGILKNIHLLMDAVNMLPEIKVKLLIFGTVLPAFKAAFENRLSDKICFVGWATAEQVMNYMIASDVACFPGTHSTLWEQAVGLGLPCIFKSWPGMRHFDVNGNCFFLDEANVDEIYRSIETMMQADSYRKIHQQAIMASKDFLYSVISKKAIEM